MKKLYNLNRIRGERRLRKKACFFILSINSNRSFLNGLFGKNSVLIIQRSYKGLFKYLGFPFDRYVCCFFKMNEFDRKLKLVLADKKNKVRGVSIKGNFINF
jgi:predicted transcriptional regulator with HTH domain